MSVHIKAAAGWRHCRDPFQRHQRPETRSRPRSMYRSEPRLDTEPRSCTCTDTEPGPSPGHLLSWSSKLRCVAKSMWTVKHCVQMWVDLLLFHLLDLIQQQFAANARCHYLQPHTIYFLTCTQLTNHRVRWLWCQKAVAMCVDLKQNLYWLLMTSDITVTSLWCSNWIEDVK